MLKNVNTLLIAMATDDSVTSPWESPYAAESVNGSRVSYFQLVFNSLIQLWTSQ